MLALWWLVACDMGPSFSMVQEMDTIEAYEEFLAKDPDGSYKFACEKRLEELYVAKAQTESTVAAWQAYIDRFPEGPNRKTADKELATLAYSEAVKANTVEAWEAWLAKFPKSDKWLVARAMGRAEFLRYGKLELGEPKVERVNMAEDPKGPLNGWGVSAVVTNQGDKALEYVSITLEYLADDGHALGAKDYPVVSKTWSMPASDDQKRPIAAGGDSRTWLWTETDEQVPKDWHQKVRLTVTGLQYVKEP